MRRWFQKGSLQKVGGAWVALGPRQELPPGCSVLGTWERMELP